MVRRGSLKTRLSVYGILVLLALILVLELAMGRFIRLSTLAQIQQATSSTSQLLNIATVPYTQTSQIHILQDYLGELVGTPHKDGTPQNLMRYVVIVVRGKSVLRAGQVPEPLPPPDDLKHMVNTPPVLNIRQPILFDDDVGFLQYGYGSDSLNTYRHELVRNALLGTLLILLIAALLFYGFSHQISERIERLIEAFQAITDGDYSRRAPVDHADELSHLAELFNRMTDAVEERWRSLLHSRAQIERLNDSLEEKVNERTHALSQVNQQLEQLIGDLRTTQAQLVESEKQAALGQIVAGIAHELNTPLGNALTLSTSLQDDGNRLKQLIDSGKISRSTLNEHIDQCDQSFDILVRNLRRATQLIQSFKQVAVDQVSDQRRNFQIGKTLEEILLSLEPGYRKHHIKVQVNIQHPELELESYPGALVHLFSNLINNAIIHAFTGIVEPTICIDITDKNAQLTILFCDNGCGIPPENISRIFEPFFTTRMGLGGTGLGLHICYNLITVRLGGSISVQSEPSQGTCFTITIPVKAPNRTSQDSLAIGPKHQ